MREKSGTHVPDFVYSLKVRFLNTAPFQYEEKYDLIRFV